MCRSHMRSSGWGQVESCGLMGAWRNTNRSCGCRGRIGRLQVLHEVRKRHITQEQAGKELGVTARWVGTTAADESARRPDFGGRQGKDEPAATGIYRGKIENVAEKCAIGFRAVALERDVGAGNSCGHAGSQSKRDALSGALLRRSAGDCRPHVACGGPMRTQIKVLTPAMASGMFLRMSFLSHFHHHHHVQNVLAGVS